MEYSLAARASASQEKGFNDGLQIGTAERLTAYILAVFCLLTLIMQSPMPVAIAQ